MTNYRLCVKMLSDRQQSQSNLCSGDTIDHEAEELTSDWSAKIDQHMNRWYSVENAAGTTSELLTTFSVKSNKAKQATKVTDRGRGGHA